jgi:hypothetical protein
MQPPAIAEPPAASGAGATSARFRHTLALLLAIYGLAVVSGVRNVWYWEWSGLDLIPPVLNGFCLTSWGLVDARLRKHPIPVVARDWFFLFSPVLVPAYVIWTRRWRGALWVILIGVSCYVLTIVIMTVGGPLMFGRAWPPVIGVR